MSLHPRGRSIGAWYDGELDPTSDQRITRHVASCIRCQASVTDLRRVRAALLADPMPPRPAPRRRPVPVAAALTVAVVVAFLVGNRTAAPATKTLAAGLSHPSGIAEGRRAASVSLSPRPQTQPTAGGRPSHAARPDLALSASTGSSRAGVVPRHLRLGVYGSSGADPRYGPAGGDEADSLRAANLAAAAANHAGGVGGEPVEIVSVPAGAVSPDVDAMVGGSPSAPPKGPVWLLPADADVRGPDVIATEVSAADAGRRLAAAVAAEQGDQLIGVVLGTGPDAAFADGLAASAPTTTVRVPDGARCDDAVTALRSRGARALAVAGPADLAARCADAALRSGWPPPAGVLLPPGAVYGGLDKQPGVVGARTVLGLPWPTSDNAGARRFRATVGSTSYRALVTFAATELAIEVARRGIPLTAASVRSAGPWRTDLVDIEDGTTEPHIATAGPAGWN
jgi:ABC-type branched-subunit amino acid transport system substrate-binding protein